MNFTDLGLDRELLRAISAQGYSEPTPIQSKSIPVILDGHDVMGRAQTGTGKTAAFTLPLLQILSEDEEPLYKGRAPRALVLTPTRELAAQVEESVATYGAHLDLTSTVIFGGVGINPQKAALRRGIDILVATPGRLLDHAGQGSVDLSEIEILVLDEADRMLDMGFIHDIRRVLKLLPRDRQNLLFSATFSSEIQKLAASFLHQPRKVQVKAHRTAAETVEQHVYRVEKAEKRHLLAHLVREGDWQQVLVFTRTKHGANRLAGQLERAGIGAAAIHGNKSQGARTRALQGFKDGTVRVLVATDIAARGLDIDRLPHVVNFELPNVPEDYVHRIGRTGRAGEEGIAMSLVSSDEGKLLRGIEHLLGHRLPEEPLPVFDKPAPQPQRTDARRDDAAPGRRRRRGRRPAAADRQGDKPKRRPPRQGASADGGAEAPKPRRRRRRRPSAA